MTIDHFTGEQHNRPIANPRLKYDFDFRKKGTDGNWRYVNSTNSIEEFSRQIESTVGAGGEYRIVDAGTNQVVKSG